MKVELSVPELVMIAATRGALGAGIGLLLAPRIAAIPRKAVGLTLLAVGALSTIPLAMEVIGKSRAASRLERAAEELAPTV